MEPFSTSMTSPQMDNLILVSWVLLIPVGVLLAVVLYKVAFFLHGLSEFMTMARYELYPTLKDLRLIADRAEVLSSKALNSVEALENGVHTASRSVDRVKLASEHFLGSMGAIAGGFAKSLFSKKK